MIEARKRSREEVRRSWVGLVVVAWAIGLSHAAAATSVATAQEAPKESVEAIVARARHDLANGQAAEAEDQLWEALKTTRDPRLLLALGDVLVARANALDASSDLGRSLRSGVVEEARGVFEEAAKSPDELLAAALGVATCHAMLGRTDDAERAMRSALATLRERKAPVEQRRRLLEELVRYVARMRSDADAQAAIAEAAAQGELDAAHVALEKLRVESSLERREHALELALAALDAKADPYEVAFLCWDACASQPYEAKLSLYSRLLEHRPDSLALRYYRGATRVLMRDGAGAIADLAPCVDAPDVGPRARGFLGRALLQAGRAEEALPHFEQLLALGGETTKDALDGLIGVAVDRARGRKFAAALELYQKVLASDPKNLWALLGRPLCHKSLGDLDQAAAVYRDALERLPDEAQLLNDYALLLKARGDRAQAKAFFEQALATSAMPGAADAGENLGIVAFRDERDITAASRHFARTLLLDPMRPRIRLYRELCLCDDAAKTLGTRR